MKKIILKIIYIYKININNFLLKKLSEKYTLILFSTKAKPDRGLINGRNTMNNKEFIDEIASYLKSFNSVKNAADALSGSLPVITVSKNEEEEREEDIEEINEYPTLTFAPRKPSTTEWPPMVSTSNIDFDFADRFDLISLITEDALQQNEQAYMSMSIKDTFEPSSRIYDLTKYSMDIPYTEAFKEYPSVYTTADMTTFVVPESDAWALLVLPCFINKRRRRV